jgi:hypothetical protein
MNETELKWSNYTQTHPDALHHTTLGDWPMISSTITVLDHVILKIHYEHPIEVVNGNNTLLYDLNINPYLSPWSNKSTAYFNIRFEPNYTNLQVNTISVNEAINPLNYEITKDGISEVVKLQIVSEYSKPLLGDLSVSFTQDEVLEQTTSGISNSVLQTEDALVGAMLITIIGFAGLLSIKHNKETKKDA